MGDQNSIRCFEGEAKQAGNQGRYILYAHLPYDLFTTNARTGSYKPGMDLVKVREVAMRAAFLFFL